MSLKEARIADDDDNDIVFTDEEDWNANVNVTDDGAATSTAPRKMGRREKIMIEDCTNGNGGCRLSEQQWKAPILYYEHQLLVPPSLHRPSPSARRRGELNEAAAAALVGLNGDVFLR